MTPHQVAVCRVLDRHMGSSLLRDREAQIVAEEGREVYDEARRITDEAIRVPVDWSHATMDQGLDAMHALLRRHYPWLTREARASLAFGFTMTWK